MKKIFLSSYFKSVAALFQSFVGEELQGKTITFIPTATLTESYTAYLGAGKNALKKLWIEIDELEISTASPQEISKKLQKNDYIYVSWGNTFFLLQELKKKGADEMIAKEVNAGKIYIGESAGSMIASSDISYVKDMDDYKIAPELKEYSALGLIDFFPIPHHTNIPFKKIVEKMIDKYTSTLNLYPISNDQAILIKGEKIEVLTK